MDKKLTDSEIVKALECAIRNDCDCNCVFLLPNKVQDVLDLINRLQAENERLKKELAKPILATRDLKVSFERIYRIGEEKALVQALKAEAFKEFAERLKKRLYNSGLYPGVEDEYICKVDNLLKELVGDDNA